MAPKVGELSIPMEQINYPGKQKVDARNNLIDVDPKKEVELSNVDVYEVGSVKKPYFLLAFVLTSTLNAVYCAAYLYKEMPEYVLLKQGIYWKPVVLGLMDLFTATRILVQILSGMILTFGLCSSNEAKTFRSVKWYIDGAFFVATEQIFSVCMNLVRIGSEEMDEYQIAMKLEYVIVNYVDLALFTGGFQYLYWYIVSNYLAWHATLHSDQNFEATV